MSSRENRVTRFYNRGLFKLHRSGHGFVLLALALCGTEIGTLKCAHLANDAVQSPALVEPCHLLPHRSEEALRVEEASDPEHLGLMIKWSSCCIINQEYLGSAVITPSLKLSVPLQQFCEPEAQSSRQPRNLLPIGRNP